MAIIVVSGALANKCRFGGEAWVRLSWIIGLQRLGHRVVFIEEISARNCVDAAGAVTLFEESVNLRYFKQVTSVFGLDQASALIGSEDRRVFGLPWKELVEITAAADLLVNISGNLTLEPLKSAPRRKAYIDIDPGFTQVWHSQGNTGLRLEGHDYFFTIGENIGRADCPLPSGNIDWRPIRQPVVLEDWPICSEGAPDRFTTVASWRGPYGAVSHAGRTFGLKVHEFRKIIALPQQVGSTFELALNIHPADHRDLTRLRDHGWRIVDPKDVAADPNSFRRYVQESSAEFSVAQGVYVETNSGWFSDRTVRYLASGKPALVQDTGFGRNIPVGEGLLAFRTLQEAVLGAEAIARDYSKHCRAARALAETYFDSAKVLPRLLQETGVAA